MSFQDPSIGGPLPPSTPREGLPPGELSPTERDLDPAREPVEQDLTRLPSHPSTPEEREAAEHDPGRQPRTYAPHSERVPKPPAPGHAELIERGLAGQIEEPHAVPGARAAAPASVPQPPAAPSSPEPSPTPSRNVTIGGGLSALATIGALLGWWYRRWQRERSRPINRLRRQVRRAAAGPAWPASGLGVGLALAGLLGRRLGARVSSEDAPARATDGRGIIWRADPASTRAEARPRGGRIWFPAINTPSPSRVTPGGGLPAVSAGARSVAPGATSGLGLGGLLTVGTAGYLVWRMLRGRGNAPRVERAEPVSPPDRVPTSASALSRVGRWLPAGRGARQPGPGREEMAPTREDTGKEAGQGVQLRQEELQARPRPVEAGEIEIRKDVVAEQQTLEVPKTREEVVIDRRPVARRPADRPVGEDAGETRRVPVHEEQVSVDKQPVVTEEIDVGTRQVQDTEQMSGDVRWEEARIERAGDVDAGGSGGGEQSRRQG